MHKTLICLFEIFCYFTTNTVTSQTALNRVKEQLVDTRYIYFRCLVCSMSVAMHIWGFVLIACCVFRNTSCNNPTEAWFKRYLSIQRCRRIRLLFKIAQHEELNVAIFCERSHSIKQSYSTICCPNVSTRYLDMLSEADTPHISIITFQNSSIW